MYSNREYYEMVRCYILSGESLNAARRLYEAESIPALQNQGLINPAVPSRETFLAVNQRLLDYGQFTSPTHARGGGRPGLAVEIEDEILDFFERDPRASTRDAARRFNVSHYAVWKLLKVTGLHPYHFQKVHALHDGDNVPRRTFCEWLIAHPNANILWTDEALFTRVGLYNHHNEHWWSFRNPHMIRKTHHHVRFSANVWAGVIGTKILGPYFIEGPLTDGNFLDMLRHVIADFMEDLPVAYFRDFYFQLDGASPHYAAAVRDHLTIEYGDRWIGRGGPIVWPARSPDLTPCDFYLWGEIKRRVYFEEVQSLEDLKVQIRAAFDYVKNDTVVLSKLKDNVQKRARLCVERNGMNFEHLLKYT
ncbi:unnamed protein product [Diatraea saccharalis]|uniref:Transposase n=1 Tax=Diatraea saccharalis TaxID=40085 RepID=A0A9N9N1X7_9NEOP|nr:unnamed protein product [Diatraea saccharalis]